MTDTITSENTDFSSQIALHKGHSDKVPFILNFPSNSDEFLACYLIYVLETKCIQYLLVRRLNGHHCVTNNTQWLENWIAAIQATVSHFTDLAIMAHNNLHIYEGQKLLCDTDKACNKPNFMLLVVIFLLSILPFPQSSKQLSLYNC